MNLDSPLKPIPEPTLPIVTAMEKRKKRKTIVEANRSSSVSAEGSRRHSNDFESHRILCDSSVSSSSIEDPTSMPSMKTQSANDITENKFLLRYDPGVPMTKEEASAWRKEERRKRNRESAAASRQKTRDRISELEDEVTLWKSKFDEAAQRIAKLEKLYNAQKEGSALAATAPKMFVQESQGPSLVTSSLLPLSTPPQSPRLSATLVSPSSMNLSSAFAFGEGEDMNTMNEEKHFKEIFQQAKYEILCH
jgi:hypothetical protein